MSVQPSLDFDAPDHVPYVAHSATSHAAAVAYAPKLRGHKRAVFLYLHERPEGTTDNHLIAALGRPHGAMSPNTPRARRRDLELAGLVVACGEVGGSTLWRVLPDLTADELRAWLGDDE